MKDLCDVSLARRLVKAVLNEYRKKMTSIYANKKIIVKYRMRKPTLHAGGPTYTAIFKCMSNKPAYNSSNVTSPDLSTSIISKEESMAF